MENEWELIYQTYVDDVYRFLVYYTGSREEAEDLTQDTFLKAVTHLQQFDARSELKTWIISIARNLALDHMRRRSRATRLRSVLGFLQSGERTETPEEVVSKNERINMMQNAIRSLKEEYRTVVILRGIQELTPTETSSVVGWNQNKVNLVYHRAMKALHKKLDEQGDDLGWIGQMS